MDNRQLAEDMTPAEIENALAVFSNELATYSLTVAKYENDLADAEMKYKREYARAVILNQRAKNSMLTKAMAEIDAGVVTSGNELAKVKAVLILGRATLEGLTNKYVALRKIANLKQTELTTMGGFK